LETATTGAEIDVSGKVESQLRDLIERVGCTSSSRPEKAGIMWILVVILASFIAAIVALSVMAARRHRSVEASDQWKIERDAARDASNRSQHPGPGGWSQSPEPW
jgi:hypothetical protein